MPTYTYSQLQALSESELVTAPEFKWNDWESVFRSRRRSSVTNRPEIDQRKKTVEFNEEELENDPDKAMAAFFLHKNPKPPSATTAQPSKEASQSTVSAAAQDSAIAEDEDGWTSVTKPRKRGMSRTSFSKWGNRA